MRYFLLNEMQRNEQQSFRTEHPQYHEVYSVNFQSNPRSIIRFYNPDKNIIGFTLPKKKCLFRMNQNFHLVLEKIKTH